ncbi:unnamed protein product [Psylliodes chrysocephalus]|uniref:CCHC-type domain-containing protein n=1 Tax=Psylliodes chrysocephalus TaxID=3402493 RepID=A0A9P0GCJ6_9CUCU|nr:unnamed protein product [Psylliodes chrysocephala]
MLNLAILDKHIIDSVIGGINDPNVSLSARAANFETVGELSNYLSHVSTKSVKNLPSTSQIYSRTSSFSSLQNKMKQPHCSSKISCYNCGDNHRVRDCTKPLVECRKCNKLGHKTEECK